ncbi:gustatory receptor for sugar taste 64e-like [Plodia interpunctella]|uniref:gustatory receptor for sugar taste 64e-like n=1 Tax=Plodia interpunctella TaxID=58824 RepID=UPI002367943E|nr:gustatory receptor for sugar taste 64e-like [Plodia interpunctella]
MRVQLQILYVRLIHLTLAIMDLPQALRNKKNIYHYPLKIVEQEYIAATKSVFTGQCATFQAAMKLTVTIGQCFGLNPVLGISEMDPSKLRFCFCSWRCSCSIASIIVQLSVVFLCVLKMFRQSDASLSSNTFLVFSSTNCMTTILFLRLSRKWPWLCQHIAKTEAIDPNMDATLARRCNTCCIAILTLALVEHLLSDLSSGAAIIDCDNKGYEGFITSSFPWIFSVLPYNDVFGFIAQLINLQCAFNWNFADVFVICISLYLTSRLDQVNRRVEAIKGKHVPPLVWRTIREDYCRITRLVRRVDDAIGEIIFMSFTNNLFFICLQLLHMLSEGVRSATPSCHPDEPDRRPLQGYEHAIYFVFSFIFLVTRSLGVSLMASRVHTASKKPAFSLYDVPSEAYCVEIQRFLNQIHGEIVALSGMNFFNVKRGIVLTIAGTIVTYELVLMQFTGVTPTAAPT